MGCKIPINCGAAQINNFRSFMTFPFVAVRKNARDAVFSWMENAFSTEAIEATKSIYPFKVRPVSQFAIQTDLKILSWSPRCDEFLSL